MDANPKLFLNAFVLLGWFAVSGCSQLEDGVVLGVDLPGGYLPAEFSLVSWNVGKGSFSKPPGATAGDLKTVLEHHDIACIQEFVPSLAPEAKGVFARSFRWWLSDAPNGVATFSRAAAANTKVIPSGWSEGWVLTPKMSLITTYAFEDTQLLVANVHALNFQPVFTYLLSSQLQDIARQLTGHTGPVVVCGDFNTWRQDRLELVKAVFRDFEHVSFVPDQRSRGGVFARLAGDASLALDHVFVKGLEVLASEVLLVESSDHRPLVVRLRSANN